MPTAVSFVWTAQGLQLSCSNTSLALFEALIIAFHLTSALNLTHLRQDGSFVMLLPISVGSMLTLGAQNWGLSCWRSLKNSSMLKLLCVDKTGSPACILSGKGDAYWETIRCSCSGYQWPSEGPARKYHSVYGLQLHLVIDRIGIVAWNLMSVGTTVCERRLIILLMDCQGCLIQCYWCYNFAWSSVRAMKCYWTCSVICFRSFILKSSTRAHLDIDVKRRILGECNVQLSQ